MDKRDTAWILMIKKKNDLERMLNEVEKANDGYRESLVDATVSDILNVISDGGQLTERDLKLFLGNLSLEVKNIYNK